MKGLFLLITFLWFFSSSGQEIISGIYSSEDGEITVFIDDDGSGCFLAYIEAIIKENSAFSEGKTRCLNDRYFAKFPEFAKEVELLFTQDEFGIEMLILRMDAKQNYNLYRQDDAAFEEEEFIEDELIEEIIIIQGEDLTAVFSAKPLLFANEDGTYLWINETDDGIEFVIEGELYERCEGSLAEGLMVPTSNESTFIFQGESDCILTLTFTDLGIRLKDENCYHYRGAGCLNWSGDYYLLDE